MVEKRYYKVANEQTYKIKPMANRKLNLDRGVFKISFTDAMLMKRILAAIGDERAYIGYLKGLVEGQNMKREMDLISE